jgi:hypothetical protein
MVRILRILKSPILTSAKHQTSESQILQGATVHPLILRPLVQPNTRTLPLISETLIPAWVPRTRHGREDGAGEQVFHDLLAAPRDINAAHDKNSGMNPIEHIFPS